MLLSFMFCLLLIQIPSCPFVFSLCCDCPPFLDVFHLHLIILTSLVYELPVFSASSSSPFIASILAFLPVIALLGLVHVTIFFFPTKFCPHEKYAKLWLLRTFQSGDISSTVRPYLASQKPAIQRRQANKNTRFLVYTLKTVFLNIFTLAVFSDLKCMKG